MNGYIALHKKILEWEWYSDINTCRVFIHILLKANWEDKKWRGIQIKRGQWATSLQTICNETSLTPREVRTALDHLRETGEIDKQTTSRYTVITVLNYDSYQISDKPSDITTTAQRQQLNKEIIKESNLKEKDKKKVVRFAPPSVDEVKAYCDERSNGIDPESFIDFYSSKGWKVGNQPMKDWRAAVRTWEKRHNTNPNKEPVSNPKIHFENERTYDIASIEARLLAKGDRYG